MRIDAFDYDLPEELIALRPLPRREDARLLHVTSSLTDKHIADLSKVLRAGDLMVVNNTKVMPTVLRATRPPRADGGNTEPITIELTLVRQHAGSLWEAMARPARRLRQGDLLSVGSGVHIVIDDKKDGGHVMLDFKCPPDRVATLLSERGQMPLPLYISSRRAIDEDDRRDYQTIFAKIEGAVAAPTANLHLTEALMSELESKGVSVAEVTLHVGLGTFLPVKVDDTDAHVMHKEWGRVSSKTASQIERVRRKGGRIVAVGTTTLRLLETAAQQGGIVAPFCGETSIFIVPGYRFKTADLLLTNFHLPRSTLFMMVSAFSGLERMRAAYRHAIAEKYRFYSYGDACLLER